jgi:hypothetical protein
VFDPKGVSVRRTLLYQPVEGKPQQGGRPKYILPTGQIVLYSYQPVEKPKGGIIRSRTEGYSVRDRAGAVRELGTYFAKEGYIVPEQLRISKGSGEFARPFTRNTLVGVGNDRVFILDTDSSIVIEADLTRGRIDSVNLELERTKVMPADRERFVADMLELAPTDLVDRYRKLFTQAPFPTEMPSADTIAVDDQDRLWVAKYPTAGDTVKTWFVFDGPRRVGSILLPRSFRITSILGKRIAGILSLPNGAERVEIRRFR